MDRETQVLWHQAAHFVLKRYHLGSSILLLTRALAVQMYEIFEVNGKYFYLADSMSFGKRKKSKCATPGGAVGALWYGELCKKIPPAGKVSLVWEKSI